MGKREAERTEEYGNMETAGNPDRYKKACSGRQRAEAVAGGRCGVRERWEVG